MSYLAEVAHIIALEVGEGLSEDLLLEALKRYANDELLPILPNLENISTRAELDDGSVELESVERLAGDTYKLEYNFTWSAHLGCQDANTYGEFEQRHSHFIYAGTTATFKWEEEAERYPNEEF